MTQSTAELVAALEAERLAPTPPPEREHPDGPTAAWMRQQQAQASDVDEPHAT